MRESYDGARTEFLTQISAKSLAHPLGYDTTNSLRASEMMARRSKHALLTSTMKTLPLRSHLNPFWPQLYDITFRHKIAYIQNAR